MFGDLTPVPQSDRERAQDQHVERTLHQIQALGSFAHGMGAALISRLIASVLYEVVARDPFTMSAVAMVVLVAAACACWVPARRATRIDPLTALRFE
jgi:ABC-type lipoprotein release transport system permease subunit